MVVDMDRETLLQAIELGPVRVTMNNGSTFDIDRLIVCATLRLIVPRAT